MNLTHTAQIISGCMAERRQDQQLLYNTFCRFAIGICRKYCSNDYEAAEIMNNGFMKVFRNLGSYRADRPFKAWIGRIMINTSLNYRKENLRVDRMQDIDELSHIEHAELPDSKLIYQDLIDTVDRLPAIEKAVFYLYTRDGLSHEDIAVELNISIGASRIRLLRARRKLKNMIEAEHSSFI